MVAGDEASDLRLPPRGLVLGRFDPPDARDAFLCAFALQACRALTVGVQSQADETVPAPMRRDCLQRLFPMAHVLAQDAPLPGDLRSDVLFALDTDVGASARADALGARLVPVKPPGRLILRAAAATAADPMAPWTARRVALEAGEAERRLPRICLFGPESTGKSTLGLALATHYDTVLAPEYGRLYTETFGQDCHPEDLRRIVVGHLAGTAAASGWARQLLIEDTDPVLTAVWSDVLTGSRAPWFDRFTDTADLYLLTGIDVPWVPDGVRYFPEDSARRRFHQLCRDELTRRSLPFVEITGDPQTRLAAAVRAIDRACPGAPA